MTNEKAILGVLNFLVDADVVSVAFDIVEEDGPSPVGAVGPRLRTLLESEGIEPDELIEYGVMIEQQKAIAKKWNL